MNRLTQVIAEYNETKLEPGEPAMTQRRLAELTGVHELTVHRHATRKTAIDLDQAVAYARVLKVEIIELVEPAK